ncbi:enoyl-CoA hydratase/isomerase family protein [Rhizomonospora bruguierae]|uniref:enoyl-CoA hydratase/isomerase family protein n=1 Tax=Rhizomonospora bruguierae TaxID=1581705 RepID=UPI001BCB8F96|nr:enoyl-CoA hydratase/isomerase family protein [Micromonospora sp. NBRC 107566]
MTLRHERRGSVATVILDRPHKINAINNDMRSAFAKAFEEIEQDVSVKVAVVRGAGPKGSCSGADMSEISGRTGLERRRQISSDPANVVRACTKPVIAALHGYTLGVRVASRSALFGYPEIRHGWIPGGGGGTQTLPRLVGMGQAMLMTLTGRTITAEEAFRIGLVQQVCADEDLVSETESLADEIARCRVDALVVAKAGLRMTERADLITGLQYEKELSTLTYYFENRAEALAAFAERRAPNFGE